MGTMPPLAINVSAKQWSCVLDIHLALSPYGLLFALRLKEEMNVWLVRSLWEVLDNADLYLHNPQALVGAVSATDANSLHSALAQWQSARLETDLVGNSLFWTGDRTQESLLPKEVDRGLVSRYEQLARSLDRQGGVRRPQGHYARLFSDCARDAVALAAALGRYRAVIFTLASATGERRGPPALCQHLKHWGIRCHRARNDIMLYSLQRYLLPIFARTGVAELALAGLDLLAVHVIAPQAHLSADEIDEDTVLPDLPAEWPRPAAEDMGLWKDATAFWYPIAERCPQ